MGFPMFNSSCISILHIKSATLMQLKTTDTFMSFVSSYVKRLAFKTTSVGNNEIFYSYGSCEKTKNRAPQQLL